MKKFMLLHIGFEPPTPDIMAAWQAWFDKVAECTVEHGGFAGGRELTHDGTESLAWGPDATTGYSIIRAESLDAAETIARDNPFIKSIRIYEIREHGE